MFANPTANTVSAGASSNVTITTSNLKALLATGTYNGSVTFKIGSGTFRIDVTLTVMPAPVLSGTPTLILANRQCKADQTGKLWVCYITLNNASTNLTLNWSTNSSINGVNFNPTGGTMQPGQSITVQITVPLNDCPTKGTLCFTGPANTVTVEWYCIVVR